MPRWAPGVSGNPSGKAKDGGSSKDAPIRRALQKRAQRARELSRFVDSWWEAACAGDAQAREQILKRLDPIIEESEAGRQILTGIKLELSPGKASVQLLQAGGHENGSPLLGSTSNQGIMGSLCPAGDELTIPIDPAQPATREPAGEASATAPPATAPTSAPTARGIEAS